MSEDYDEKTSIYYILALYLVANGNKMAAMENLTKVAERNKKILPIQ